MTITEQLQFSVLTAPVATMDRRTLSQAWYSALYGNADPARPQAKQAALTQAEGRRSPQTRGEKLPAGAASELAKSGPDAKASTKVIATLERRAPRSALARKITRTFRASRHVPQKTSFTVDAAQGRVHVLLQTRGSQLKLIAICPPRARAQVAEALAQARYNLAARGIDVDADARESSAC